MHAGLGEEARGIRAACAVASAHGLACGEASILAYKGGNIVVHLAPSPVVARTATLRAALHVDIERWLRREVAIGRFLADALRGKRKPEYTPHIDTGDFVIVVNAEKIVVTGNKRADKRYYRHSGYPGGLRSRTFEEMLARRPEEIIRLAVKGMLPRNRLARKQLTKLKIYAGPDHPHAAQKPQPMEIEGQRASA